MSYRDKLNNVVRINRLDDFNVQDADTITLEEGKIYVRGAEIVTDKRFIVEPNVVLTHQSFDAGERLIYTGTGDMFTGVDVRTFSHRWDAISAPNANQIYNFSDVGSDSIVYIQDVRGFADSGLEKISQKFGTFTDLETLQIVNCGFVSAVDETFSLGLDGGLTLIGDFSVLTINRLALGSASSAFKGLEYPGATFQVFEVNNIIFVAPSGAIGISGDEDSANIAPGVIATVRDCEFIGGVTPLENISSGDKRYDFDNCPPVSDSTIKGILQFDGNTDVTVMSGPNVPTPINTLWSDGNVEERICFSDKVTFDNTTNTCTAVDGAIDATGGTAFNHGLANGDKIELRENGGLPAELQEKVIYYVGSVTATTFQLYADSGLTTLVEFTDDGTEPNYYCHTTGDSASGWFVYTGEVATSLSIEGWVTVQKVSGADSPVRAVLMKTDTSYAATRDANGSTVSARNGVPLSSQVVDILDVVEDEGFVIYVENGMGGVDNEVTDSRMICSRS